MNDFNNKVSFIWSIAELLRGPYRPNQYKDVMLPMTILRRLDCALEPTKDAVLEKAKSLSSGKITNLEPILNKVAEQSFHNTSRFTFEKLKGDPDNIAANLVNYINGFSAKARDIIGQFGFEEHIANLDKADRLYMVVSKFCDIDLHPDEVSNIEMGYIFEELIRKFNEASNEEAGDHFTPREVIRLMVDLIYTPDADVLTTKGVVKTLYDPACGTGGMLSVSEEYLRELNSDARLEVFGQDFNPQSYAVCGSDMMIKGQSLNNIRFGDSFTDDNFPDKKFDYMLANPPFGVEWKPQQSVIKQEHDEQGFGGRFGPGLPRVSDGALLFLLHMISKMKNPKEGGTRLAIVFNGSPLFTGSAGSGESEIRRWIIENDWLEAIVALPDQLFYNTGISTYLWIVSNRKEPKRRGKVQLIDGTSFFQKMRKSLGEKRKAIGDAQREEIVRLFGNFEEGEYVRIFDSEEFGYKRVTVERPLKLNFSATHERIEKVKGVKAFQAIATSKKRKDQAAAQAEIKAGRRVQEDIISAISGLEPLGVVQDRDRWINEIKRVFKKKALAVPGPLLKGIVSALSEQDNAALVCVDKKGNPQPDSDLRDNENVPLNEEISDHIRREVLPYVPEAWVDETKTKVGYEINFNRYFYTYAPPRPLKEIEKELKAVEAEIATMLAEVTE